MANKSKYTKTVVRKICSSVRQGLSFKDSAIIAGITEETLNQWTRKLNTDGTENLNYKPELDLELQEANAKAKLKLIKEIRASKDWKSKAWIMERTYPQQYAIKQLSEHKIEGEIKFKIVADTPRIEPINGEIEELPE